MEKQQSDNRSQLTALIPCKFLEHALIVFFLMFSAISFADESSRNKVITMNPQLEPCPNSPNCVNSTDTDGSHTIPALNIEGTSPEKAMQALQQVLMSMTDNVQTTDDGLTVHAEFKSAVFGFIDDVDAILNADQHRIEIRSASRTGHSDFGVNRRRVESIREAFAEALR